ncbi:MAG: tetratricopeptide repeat protein [Syntrophobacteraceae bacterium]
MSNRQKIKRTAETYSKMALSHKAQGDVASALRMAEKAAALNPRSQEIRLQYADLLLVTGDFERGFAEYAASQESSYAAKFPDVPIWNGEDPRGKAILFGTMNHVSDLVMFARYIPIIAELGAEVIVASPLNCGRLLGTVGGVTRLAVYDVGVDSEPIEVNAFCPTRTAPLIFKTSLDSIPAKIPYLLPDAGKVEFWKGCLNSLCPGQLKVGLACGNEVSLSDLRPLFNIPGVQIWDLHPAMKAVEAKGEPSSMAVFSGVFEKFDLADLAAMIQNLDLVVSTDNYVAHLAGALGKSVWLLCRFSASWVWLLQRQDSPWYPTMKIFRQPVSGDWKTVVELAAAEITQEAVLKRNR